MVLKKYTTTGVGLLTLVSEDLSLTIINPRIVGPKAVQDLSIIIVIDKHNLLPYQHHVSRCTYYQLCHYLNIKPEAFCLLGSFNADHIHWQSNAQLQKPALWYIDTKH